MNIFVVLTFSIVKSLISWNNVETHSGFIFFSGVVFKIMFSEEFNKVLEDKVSKELGYKLDKEKIQKLSDEERLKANVIILSESQNEMLKRLENNQFEYMTEKTKMILEKKKKEWEYKNEETLESDGFDIFDSMFENLENNLNEQ